MEIRTAAKFHYRHVVACLACDGEPDPHLVGKPVFHRKSQGTAGGGQHREDRLYLGGGGQGLGARRGRVRVRNAVCLRLTGVFIRADRDIECARKLS